MTMTTIDENRIQNETQPLLSTSTSTSTSTTTTTTTQQTTTSNGGGSGKKEENDNNKASLIPLLPSITEEAIDIIKLGIPIFIARLSFVGMKTTDTALLGHVSREALSASALSDLWTMCSLVLLNGGVLSVLVGGAIGAGNTKLAGIYLRVSYVVLSCLAIPVMIAWNLTEQVWTAFGSDPKIAQMAGYYSSVLSLAIPGIIMFGQLSQFFSAQRIMHPEVHASIIGLLANLVLGLIFVLGWPPILGIDGYQFTACPIVTTCVTYVQLATIYVVYIKIQKLHQPCWGGDGNDGGDGGWGTFQKEITWHRIKVYCTLYFPAALSIASDFWRVAVIGAVAATLGEEEVAVFNTSYRIMWIALIFVGALSGASSINMSIRLGKMDSIGAKQAGFVGIGMAMMVLLLLCVCIVFHSHWFGKIFTNDVLFLQMLEQVKVPFTITLFFMNLAVALERIPYSMGRTTEVFWMGFIASWGGQVPAVILCTTYWRNDLVGLYTGMAIGYGLLVLLYGTIVLRSDWDKYAELAHERSEAPKPITLVLKDEEA